MTDSVYDPTPRPAGDYTPATAPASSLEELRAAVAQSEQVAEIEFKPCVLFGPGNHIRLTCSTEDADHNEWKAIQIASQPPAYRKKRIPDPRKVDEIKAFAALIGSLTREIAVLQPGGDYKVMDGDFNDPHLLAAFGVAEAALAVQRIFVKDAYLLHAGQELINACGFGERKPGEAGDEDPT